MSPSTVLPIVCTERCCWVFPPMSKFLYLLFALSVGMTPLTAQEGGAEAISREHRVKAAYLYQFGRYVEWPASAFASAESPFVIGVLAEDPIAFEMSQILQDKKTQNRPIEIRRFAASAENIACHMLFLSGAVPSGVQAEVLRRVSGKPILLVGDAYGFAERGGVIGFVVEDDRIRLNISKKTAERQGLIISSKLLRVTRVVD
jgi:hypothetical protein